MLPYACCNTKVSVDLQLLPVLCLLPFCYGAQVIQDFCKSAQHLQHNTDWVQVKRIRTAAQAGQQQQFQQHLQQFRMTQPGPGMTQLGSPSHGPGQAAVQAGPWITARAGSGSGGGQAAATQNAAAAAAAAAGGGGSSSAAEVPWWQQGQQQQQAQAPVGAPSPQEVTVVIQLLLPDAEVYQGLLDSKVLAEPKKAAQSAWEQWEVGRTVAQIATEGREKPIQVCRGCRTSAV